MLDTTKDVQGVAMYAQFIKDSGLLQMLVTPDGYSVSGGLVPASLYRRVTTTYQPKRQWRGTIFEKLNSSRWQDPESPLIDGMPVDPLAPNDKDRDLMEKIANVRLEYIGRVFSTIISQDWTLDGDPIFVEISKKDIDDIAVGKTPSKLMYRVNNLREAGGYAMAPKEGEVV